MTIDWRSNITEFDSLDDLDLVELMNYLRHQYLCAAKDLIKSHHSDDVIIGEQCSMAAEHIHQAIEDFTGRA